MTALTGSLEYSVMLVLWELGTATARELHTRVGEPGVHDDGHRARSAPRQGLLLAVARRPEIRREQVDRACTTQRDAVASLVNNASTAFSERIHRLLDGSRDRAAPPVRRWTAWLALAGAIAAALVAGIGVGEELVSLLLERS